MSALTNRLLRLVPDDGPGLILLPDNGRDKAP